MPAPPPAVRTATAADEIPLGELDRRNWSPRYAVHPRPVPPYAPFFDAAHLPADHLVAELDGLGVVGFIRVVPPTGLPSHAHVRAVHGLVVDERARRRGVARALLEAACERARQKGAQRMTLRVLGPNRPARELYGALGFLVEGVLPGEFLLDGEYVDDVLMGRPLAQP
ncbi:L-amino acid N-acyltransferase YncA [Streptomyces sp. Amel2xB2]|uniref:GNAT family N-acetyltransferase n=1 Tax=Streptomyces sp. Amel2xB2 TaxID=1305829 RepID=UPI000DBA2F42|nr:GNAT family N-acetyltransferase [Streptomyces sp. Amel2xB2]RAJ65396.1 L-amino acid N-acyltransferase YncA [Streptomyces sp. Amel2xB2]